MEYLLVPDICENFTDIFYSPVMTTSVYNCVNKFSPHNWYRIIPVFSLSSANKMYIRLDCSDSEKNHNEVNTELCGQYSCLAAKQLEHDALD